MKVMISISILAFLLIGCKENQKISEQRPKPEIKEIPGVVFDQEAIVLNAAKIYSSPSASSLVFARKMPANEISASNLQRSGFTYVDSKQFTGNDTSKKTIKGWIESATLATRSSFKKVTRIKPQRLSGCIADHCPDYTLRGDGSYTMKKTACVEGSCPKDPAQIKCNIGRKVNIDGGIQCVSEGHLFRNENLYWLKNNGPAPLWELIIKAESGEFCSSFLGPCK